MSADGWVMPARDREYFRRVRLARAELDGWTSDDRRARRLVEIRCPSGHLVGTIYETTVGALAVYASGRWTYAGLEGTPLMPDGAHPRDVRGAPHTFLLLGPGAPDAIADAACPDRSCPHRDFEPFSGLAREVAAARRRLRGVQCIRLTPCAAKS